MVRAIEMARLAMLYHLLLTKENLPQNLRAMIDMTASRRSMISIEKRE
jgi:hypothetical protein